MPLAQLMFGTQPEPIDERNGHSPRLRIRVDGTERCGRCTISTTADPHIPDDDARLPP